MSPEKQLKAVFDELLAEVGRNNELRQRLAGILEGLPDHGRRPERRSARRQPGRFDPMAIYREHPGDLARKLAELTIDELKDMVAENGMDRTKLAMKWKAKDRLIELIVSAVTSRAQKGDVFRSGPVRHSNEEPG